MATFYFQVVLLVAVASRTMSIPYGYGPNSPSDTLKAVSNTDEKTSFAIPPAATGTVVSDLAAEEKFPPRDYHFQYNIQDGIVGMSHTRSETSEDGVTKGSYSYTRPDGKLVVVSYTADANGFHPVITEEVAPGLRVNGAVHTIVLPDHPETINVSITEEDLKLAQKQSEKSYPAVYSDTGYGSYNPTTSPSVKGLEIAAPVRQAYY